MKSLSLSLFLFVLFMACRHDIESNIDADLKEAIQNAAPNRELNYFLQPDGLDLSKIPNQDAKNPLNNHKVALGRLLFHETGIGLKAKDKSMIGTYSCATCHVASMGFTPGRFQGVADGAVGFGESGEGRRLSPSYYTGDSVDAQGARPLTMHNLAYVTNTLWAGTFGSFGTNVGTEHAWHQDTLVEINFLGLEGLEANNFRALQVHRQFMDRLIADSLGYASMFDAAFPEIPKAQRYSLLTTAFAIAAYQRTILTNAAPFQLYLRGNENAMTEQQKRGAKLFFTKANCSNCHQGPALNNMRYIGLGVYNLYQSDFEVFRTGPNDKRNFGRGGFTGNQEDMHKFKVPQLYNLKHVPHYFHGASKTSLEDVVEYFDKAEPENPLVPASQISSLFRPLHLTAEEKADLVEFLRNGLYDPYIERYVPEKVGSGHCIPNSDPYSKKDLGCN